MTLGVFALLHDRWSRLALTSKAPRTQQHQRKNAEVGELTEDDEQEGEGLVGGARPAVNVVVDEDDLGYAEGVAHPYNGSD